VTAPLRVFVSPLDKNGNVLVFVGRSFNAPSTRLSFCEPAGEFR
jgi:hypothetical protein